MKNAEYNKLTETYTQNKQPYKEERWLYLQA